MARLLELVSRGGPDDIFGREIETGTDLDLHWAEFSVSGSTRPVLRIIDVLERRDRIRERLTEWLERPVGILAGCAAGGLPVACVRSASIAISPLASFALGAISTASRCLRVGSPSRDHFDAVRRTLPFALAPTEVNHIAVKLTAEWSLASNARQHKDVSLLYLQERGRRTGRARQALDEIVAFGSRS